MRMYRVSLISQEWSVRSQVPQVPRRCVYTEGVNSVSLDIQSLLTRFRWSLSAKVPSKSASLACSLNLERGDVASPFIVLFICSIVNPSRRKLLPNRVSSNLNLTRLPQLLFYFHAYLLSIRFLLSSILLYFESPVYNVKFYSTCCDSITERFAC